VAAVVVCCALSACSDTTEGVRTQFVGAYAFTPAERRAIARIAGAAAVEVRHHLPALPGQITLQVRSGTDIIPELGAGATALPPDWIVWTVDPGHPDGVLAIAEKHLRAALFHEFHHLVRLATISDNTLIDRVITEGLATAFERDVAGVTPPWGQYPDDVSTWVDELMAPPATASANEWIFRHPDGRRWIGMRAGTHLVDLAMAKLNRTSAELATASAKDILAAAGRRDRAAASRPLKK
jgi:hypothetical protein